MRTWHIFLLLLQLPAFFLGAQSDTLNKVDSMGKRQGWRKTDSTTIDNLAREHAMNRMDTSLHKEVSGQPEKSACAPRFYGNDCPYVLYNSNKQITKKGCFKNFRLMDGEERIYDNNGVLVQIRIFKDFKYVGDAPLPAEK